MNDIIEQFNAVQREVGSGKVGTDEARTVLLRRSYEAEIDDVWDALSNPDRIGRWFLPVSGDLRLGGTFQFTGNAGGEILVCEPPRRVRATWVFGEMPPSEVEVRLSPGAAGKTEFELEHIVAVDEHWKNFGPGAVGVGWDGAVLGLALHLRGETISPAEAEAWQSSPEARDFMTRCSEAWGVAHRAAGATEDDAAAAVAGTLAFYVPPQA